MSIGKTIEPFGSKLFDGPLGVVQVAFKGIDLGLTTADSVLKPDIDMKDITYQQKGTKAYDHVVTGCDWVLSLTIGEISTEALTTIAPYLVGSSGSVGADSGHIKADLYTSLLDTIAGALKISPVIDQSPSEEIEDTMFFYTAIPVITGDFLQWGADTQRNINIEFKIKIKVMTDTESTTIKSAHGYWGDPTVEDLPAVTWPDLEAPYPVSAVVNSEAEVAITLSEEATAVAGVTQIERFMVSIDGVFVLPTAVAYATNVVTLTLPASSIASGDVVTLSGSADTFEDSEDTPNQNEAFSELLATNAL